MNFLETKTMRILHCTADSWKNYLVTGKATPSYGHATDFFK